MSLDDSVLKFVGKTVHTHPFYGWGWARRGKNIPIPDPFEMRIHSFWDDEGERRGGIGRVEQAGHPFDRYWVVFSTVVVGSYNFEQSSSPHGFNLQISHSEPTERYENVWPVPPTTAEMIGGYGHLAADEGKCRTCQLQSGDSIDCPP